MKALNLADPKRFPISKFFYKDLTSVFRDGESAEKRLQNVEKAPDEEISEGLVKAIVKYRQTGIGSLS